MREQLRLKAIAICEEKIAKKGEGVLVLCLLFKP